MAGLGALALLPASSATASPPGEEREEGTASPPRAAARSVPATNLLPNLSGTHAPTVSDTFWHSGPVPLETYWRRMANLTALPAFARIAPLDPEHRQDPLFGICNALAGDDSLTPLMRGIGASIDRIELRWDEVEPLPGERRWERFDRVFAAAERWDLQLLPVLIGAPRWAVDHADRAGAGPPSDWPAWERFVADASARYGKRAAAWEVWNEPNIREFWRGSLAEYARLLRIAYPLLSPTAPVLMGGMVQDDGSWLRTLIREEAPFDAVAWHVYGEADEVTRLAALTRSLTDRPIWITEASAPLLPLYALAKAAGVERVLIYRAADVGDHTWGLLREDLTLKPSFLTYRTAARWLGSRAFVKQHSPAHVELEGAHVVWEGADARVLVRDLVVYPSGSSSTSRT